MTNNPIHAQFTDDLNGVVITDLTVIDREVVREAQRWTSGERGSLVDDECALSSADLTQFATKAIIIGAHALSVTGQAQDAQAIERMITDLGNKTTSSTAEAAKLTGETVQAAAKTVAEATDQAQRALREADAATRKALTESVSTAKKEIDAELKRVFSGTDPEVVSRLAPLLTKFAADIDTKVSASATQLLATAAKQFDPSDPSSPMAKHAAELAKSQDKLTEQMTTQHTEVGRRLDEIATAVKVQEAKATIAKVSPIKGDTYANQMHTLLESIAAGLGDEYVDTGAVTGEVPRSKKGDGVFIVNGGAARLVVEMTDSAAKREWTSYLDEAERNRCAHASLGFVRSIDDNGGQSVRMLDRRRIVLAFDPDTDDTDLLRTVVMLLRASALTVATRSGAQEIATAEEKIAQAVVQLEAIDAVKKTAGTIQKSAVKIESSCTSITTAITRLLDDALAALGGVESASSTSTDSASDAA